MTAPALVDLAALEAARAQAAQASMRASVQLCTARRLGLTVSAGHLDLLVRRRDAVAYRLKDQCRVARVAAGLCERCGVRPLWSAHLCGDCADDMAS